MFAGWTGTKLNYLYRLMLISLTYKNIMFYNQRQFWHPKHKNVYKIYIIKASLCWRNPKKAIYQKVKRKKSPGLENNEITIFCGCCYSNSEATLCCLLCGALMKTLLMI